MSLFALSVFADAISFTVVGAIVGLIIGAIVYAIGNALARRNPDAPWHTIGICLAILIFLVCAFDWYR